MARTAAAVTGLALATRVQTADAATSPTPELFVLVTLEDVSAAQLAHASSLGLTPTLDALRASGIEYRSARAAGTACKPARAALSASQWPHESGFRSNQGQYVDHDSLAPDGAHYPTLLRSAGVPTLSVGKTIHINAPRRNLAGIFDTVVSPAEPSHAATDYADNGYTITTETSGGADLSWGVGPRSDHADSAVRAKAIQQLNRGFRGLLWVGFHAPHDPWVCAPKFLDAVPDDGFVFGAGTSGPPSRLYQQMRSNRTLATAVRHFLGAIHQVDAELGLLVAAARDAVPGCPIVVTADHGIHAGEQNMIGQKNTTHPASTDVPLIWSDGRSEAASGARTELVSHVDLAPTILERFGVTPPGEMVGRDLADLSSGRTIWTATPRELVRHDADGRTVVSERRPRRTRSRSTSGRWLY